MPNKKQITLSIIVLLFCFPNFLFSQTPDSLMIREIKILGNNRTKKTIIERELLFKIREFYAKKDIDSLLYHSKINLNNTGLFNFVDLKFLQNNDFPPSADVFIKVTERWYLWLIPLLEFADRDINSWLEEYDFRKLSYGMNIEYRNFRGRNELLQFLFMYGFDKTLGLQYKNPYLNKAKTLGLSIGFSWTGRHSIPVETVANKLIYNPQETSYGISKFNANTSLIFRKNIHVSHEFKVAADYISFAKTLVKKYPKLTVDNKHKLSYISLSYTFKYDYRDAVAYPLKGHYFDLQLKQNGIALLDFGADHFTVLSEFRKYFELKEPLYFAIGGVAFASSSRKIPYYLRYALGYKRNIVRGYEHYMIDAQQFLVLKSNLKLRLYEVKEKKMNVFTSEKFDKVHFAFFINAFLDYGYANENYYHEQSNTLTNKNLVGYGVGLDFVTYYDKVMRLEYSFNHLHEHGIYIHLIAPI